VVAAAIHRDDAGHRLENARHQVLQPPPNWGATSTPAAGSRFERPELL